MASSAPTAADRGVHAGQPPASAERISADVLAWTASTKAVLGPGLFTGSQGHVDAAPAMPGS